MQIIGCIRVGDRAACGGMVAQSESGIIVDGRECAFKGAKMACQRHCTIAQAAGEYTLCNGADLPHHGHLTTGGCPLESSANDLYGFACEPASAPPARFILGQDGQWMACPHTGEFDILFVIKNHMSGLPVPNIRYRISLESGTVLVGTTNQYGLTELVSSDQPERATIEVPYHGDSTTDPHTDHQSDACAC